MQVVDALILTLTLSCQMIPPEQGRGPSQDGEQNPAAKVRLLLAKVRRRGAWRGIGWVTMARRLWGNYRGRDAE